MDDQLSERLICGRMRRHVVHSILELDGHDHCSREGKYISQMLDKLEFIFLLNNSAMLSI